MYKTSLYKLAVILGLFALGACGGSDDTPTPTSSTPPSVGDTTAPTINSVAVTNITPTSATITWNTNEASSTQVQYGTTTVYDSIANGTSNATSHSVALNNLTANTLYHYFVMSADDANNSASSADATFTTVVTPTPIPNSYTITINRNGVGTVTSTTGGINCGSVCSANVTPTTNVTLSAVAGSGFTFSGWSGTGISCPGTEMCTVTVNANQTVIATFTNSTTQILFEEHFDTPGTSLYYGFEYAKFGDSDPARQWDREHLTSGGINGGSAFRTTSTFDSINPDGGTSYYFMKDFTGSLATYSRDFWVRQCMKYSEGFIDARILRPINPKINYFIATNGGILNYSMTSGAFQARERVLGQISGARADFFQPDASSSRVTNILGTFQTGETVVGQTSGARASFASYDPQWRNMQLNHFWHPGDVGDGSRGDGYQDLRWQDQTNGYYFPANNPLNEVRHTNFLILQEHYNEWMCIETHIDMDQVPWLAEIYVTTAPGAATLASGTTAIDTNNRRQFNDYLYIRFSNPVAPALEAGFGINWNEYGSYGGALLGDQVYFDEMIITTGKVGHPFLQ